MMQAETGAASASLAPEPRANPDLFGHEAIETNLHRLFASDRLPHAMLLAGPRGIGKATLAFRFARFVLAQAAGSPAGAGLAIAAESGVFRRVASGGHADLLTVERGYDVRRRRLRGEIVVDDAREIGAFLRLTPAEGGWRVVVVDGADTMNRNAANAMLKILEEPPRRAVLLLVAHSPGRLLPTIRSRCRRLAVAPLPADLVRQLLRRYRPDLSDSAAEALTRLADGSIGRALELAEAGGVELYETLLDLLSRSGGSGTAAAHAVAERVARNGAEEAYQAAEILLSQLLARLSVAAARGDARYLGDPREQALFRRFGGRVPAARWAELRGDIERDFARAEALNLDRKQLILGALFAIEAAAG